MYFDAVAMAYQRDHSAFFQKINGFADDQGLMTLDFVQDLLGPTCLVAGNKDDAVGIQGMQGKGVNFNGVVLDGFLAHGVFEMLMHEGVFQQKDAKGLGWGPKGLGIPKNKIGQIKDKSRFDLIFVKHGLSGHPLSCANKQAEPRDKDNAYEHRQAGNT
jgi:hypothetical protein